MRLLLTLLVLAATLPQSLYAQGYLTPESVLEQNQDSFLQPSRKRGAQWAADLETELNKQRHPSILKEPWDTPVVETAPNAPVAQEPAFDPNTYAYSQDDMYRSLDPLTARLLERLARENIAQSNSVITSTAGASGAPLAGTGPAAMISVGVMLIASLWTLRRARMLERFVQSM